MALENFLVLTKEEAKRYQLRARAEAWAEQHDGTVWVKAFMLDNQRLDAQFIVDMRELTIQALYKEVAQLREQLDAASGLYNALLAMLEPAGDTLEEVRAQAKAALAKAREG
jgi:hypothetical protein